MRCIQSYVVTFSFHIVIRCKNISFYAANYISVDIHPIKIIQQSTGISKYNVSDETSRHKSIGTFKITFLV